MIQGKRDSKGIFTAEGDLSTKGMTILHQLLSDSASAHHSTGTKNLQLNPLRVHEPLAAEFKPTGQTTSYNPFDEFEKELHKLNPVEQVGKTVEFLEKVEAQKSLEELKQQIKFVFEEKK